MNTKNFIIVSLTLLVFAILSLSVYLPHQYDASQEPQMSAFPVNIGEWEGKDVPVSERDYAILATKNLIMREYTPAGQELPVLFYLIYSGDNRKSIHPPEICYTGGGSTIQAKKVVPLTARIKANKFTILSNNHREMVAYWFRVNGLNTASFLEQQIKTATQRTFRSQSSGAMLRLSTPVISGKEDEAFSRIKAFASQIEPLLDKYIP